MTNEDASTVRSEVVQYFIDQELQELKLKNPQIKIKDLPYLQFLPQFHESDAAQVANEPVKLPPLFPPTVDYVSWDQLERLIPPKQPVRPDEKLIWPPWYCVAIIGAGVAGLRTAMLLQARGIPYKIFEASDRPGGRAFTYQFPSSPESPQGKYDYYDVGAMRFPNNKLMKRTFDLIEELDLSSNLIEYVLSIDANIRHYNNIGTTAVVANSPGDHFKDEIVPPEYLEKVYTDPWDRKHYGVKACLASASDPFRKALIDNPRKGWDKLMEYDWASTRSYLTRELDPRYPLSVVHWMETRTSGTGLFDGAFSEAILSSLEFDDPTKKVEWKCLKGGTKVLIDAMLDKLTIKPSYGQRVTSVEQVSLTPHECFPNLPKWPLWPDSLHFPFMKVSVSGQSEYFCHVVSTVPLPALSTINTAKVTMSYKQRHSIRTLNHDQAVKVAIKFKTRWWEEPGINQRGGCSYTDRPSRVVIYPSEGLDDKGPGVLMIYNWQQDASRFGALIKNPDWSDQPDPGRERPWSEKVLLDQIYEDLAVLHKVDVARLRKETLDYHAFDWNQNPYTMGTFARFTPGQFRTFFPAILETAGYGRFHFAGEVVSAHRWIAGALDSAVRAVDEIFACDFPIWLREFRDKFGKHSAFRNEDVADKFFIRGLFSKELEEAEKQFAAGGLVSKELEKFSREIPTAAGHTTL